MHKCMRACARTGHGALLLPKQLESVDSVSNIAVLTHAYPVLQLRERRVCTRVVHSRPVDVAVRCR
jgi:hypothetical protein